MFTGLIEELGTVRAISRRRGYQILTIQGQKVLWGTSIGDSIGVNGVCQTVVSLGAREFKVETLKESLGKTTLGSLQAGQRVHLERAAALGQRMGGHLVQGHVEGTGFLLNLEKKQENWYARIGLPQFLLARCISEGSIALDGVSLTIAKIDTSSITVNLIPETIHTTLWKFRKLGDEINVETDVLGRYALAKVESDKSQPNPSGKKIKSKITAENLAVWGYGT